MIRDDNKDRFDSVEDLIAHLEWENLHLKMALAEAKRERSQAYGQLLQAHAALREIPKFMSMYVGSNENN